MINMSRKRRYKFIAIMIYCAFCILVDEEEVERLEPNKPKPKLK